MNTITHTTCRTLFVAAVAGALALSTARGQTPEEMQQIKSTVEQMKKTIDAQNNRIDELEKTKASPGSVDSTLDPKYLGFIPVPNTGVLIKFNAKPHVDMMYDNGNAGNHNRFVPAVFPLSGDASAGGGAQFHMTANATQLKVDVIAPSKEGNLRFFYQNDFFGSGSDTGDMKYRVQHIYGQFYGFKAGFTYGAWEDPDSWPDTVDYEGPNAVIFSRRPVVQYTQSLNKDWNITYGVEKPDIYVDTNSGPRAPGRQLTRMPDFAVNSRYEKAGFGHLQFSGTLRDLGVQDSAGEHHVVGWGVNASAGIDISETSTLQALAVYGKGVGGMGNDTSFLNSDAAFNSAGTLEALPYTSLNLGWTQKWTKELRSTFTYGRVKLDNTNGQSQAFYHTSTYASANVVKQLHKRMSVGLEALYGKKEVRDGRTSDDMIRIQLGMVYSLFD
jgi:hypothetical protein